MALIYAPGLNNQVVTPGGGQPSVGDTVVMQPVTGSDKQKWHLVEVNGIPGVFTITNKSDSSLYLTSPEKETENVTLAKKKDPGSLSQMQMWRLVPGASGAASNSYLQNYAKGSGLVMDTQGKTGSPICMSNQYNTCTDLNQSFYIDLVDF